LKTTAAAEELVGTAMTLAPVYPDGVLAAVLHAVAPATTFTRFVLAIPVPVS
jgi:hypothetical protein